MRKGNRMESIVSNFIVCVELIFLAFFFASFFLLCFRNDVNGMLKDVKQIHWIEMNTSFYPLH